MPDQEAHIMNVPQHIRAFWKRFLDSQSDPAEANGRFYDLLRIGTDNQSADKGARLILSGEKTATSSLLWEYEDRGKPLPYVGALSVVEDSKRRPVCVIETTWVKIIPFNKIDARFAYDYGETDGS